jgi:hypothetical protein
MKSNARVHIMVLDALDEADRLTRLVAEHAHRSGRLPLSLTELVRAGRLPRLPVDESGVAFEYDPEAGKVSVSKRSTLWRPPS